MDDQRFDSLARLLASGTSRRRVFKGVLAGVAGGTALVPAKHQVAATISCAPVGGVCQVVAEAGAVSCCEGLVCCDAGDLGECAVCCSDLDCGVGEICCAGDCHAIECCIDDADPNARCPVGTSCFEGYCDPLGCASDLDCLEGTCCCNDGTCYAECCEKPEEPVDPPVTGLPNTGMSANPHGNSWLGVAALGGGAAYLAGKLLRRQSANSNDQ